MAMTRKHQFRRAHNIGKAVAKSYFEDFVQNPEYRGPNFSWAQLPHTVARMAYVHVGTSFAHGVKPDVNAHAAETAFTYCCTYVVEAGLATIKDIGSHEPWK